MRVQVAPEPAQTVPSDPMPAVLRTVRGHEQSPLTVNKDRRTTASSPEIWVFLSHHPAITASFLDQADHSSHSLHLVTNSKYTGYCLCLT